MTQVEQAAFACAACGKQFRWKAELAGKTVKCKCGNPLKVPAGPGGGKTVKAPPGVAPGLAAARTAEVRPPADADGGADLDGLYALAAEEQRQASTADSAGIACPGCRSPLAAGSVICVSCGTDLRTGRRATVAAMPVEAPAPSGGGGGGGGGGGAAAGVIPMWGVRPRNNQETGTRGFNSDNLIYEGSKFRNVFLPTILIAVGLLFYVGQLALARDGGERFAAGAFAIFILANAAVDAILIFGALLFCAKFLDMGFGAIGPAILKIFAIAIGPTALGDILIRVLAEPLGGLGAVLAGGIVAIVLYYTLIKVFFDLDLGETILLTGIIYMLQRWVKFFILMALLSGLMTGGGSDDDDYDGGSDADEVGSFLGVEAGPSERVEIQPFDPSAVFKERPRNDRDNNAPVNPDEDPRVIAGVMEEVYRDFKLDPKFGNSDTYNRVHLEASIRAQTMPSERKQAYIDKAEQKRERSELVGLYVAQYMDKVEQARSAGGSGSVVWSTVEEEASAKVDKLTPEQIKAELKTQRAEAKVRGARQRKAWQAEAAKEAEANRKAAREAAVEDGFDVDPNEANTPPAPGASEDLSGDEDMSEDEDMSDEDEDAPAPTGDGLE